MRTSNRVQPAFYTEYSECVCISIHKEELKTVVRELLACTQPNRHETFTALWNPYRRVSSRGRLAQVRFSRGARGEKPENDRPPCWFYEKVYGLPCTVRTMLLWKCHHRNAIVCVYFVLHTLSLSYIHSPLTYQELPLIDPSFLSPNFSHYKYSYASACLQQKQSGQ